LKRATETNVSTISATSKTRLVIALSLLLLAAGSPASAGPFDSPLPLLAVGTTARVIGFVPGVIKNNNIETVLMCSSLEPVGATKVHVGFEIFDAIAGPGPLNKVAVGFSDGAATLSETAPFARTATITTGATVVFHEDDVITGLPVNVKHGIGRIVSTSKRIACNAFATDQTGVTDEVIPLKVILRGQHGD